MKYPRRYVWLASSLFVFVLFGTLFWRARQKLPDADTVLPLPADAGSVPESAPVAQPYVGVVLAERAVDVVARVDGVLAAMQAKVGQRVAANDVVARIDPLLSDQELAMGEAAARATEAELARVKGEVTEAERQTVYRQGLLDAGVGSAEEVEVARFSAKTARLRVAEVRARLQERQARLVELRRSLAAAVVRAPFEGTVAARYVDPGASVQAQTRLLRLVGSGKSIVRFAVPQTDAETLRLGAEIHATCAEGRGKISARVDSISPEVDPAANMLFIEAEVIESSGDAWHSGELVNVARPSLHAGRRAPN